MSKFVKILCAITSCLVAGSANAQTSTTVRNRVTNQNFNDIYIQNLKAATFGNEYGGPNKTLLTSDLAANFVLVNSPKLPFFVVAMPEINIRLFSAMGSPVKSPSYTPGLAIYFRANSDAYHSRFFSVAYNHHSNGIEGPTFYNNGVLNVDSGKFTTNFYTFLFHAGIRVDKQNLIINSYIAGGAELHAGLIGKGRAAGLDGKYGWVRAKGSWLYSLAKKYQDPIYPDKKEFHDWMRMQLDLQYILDKYNEYSFGDAKKRLNAGVKYYYQLPFMQNTAFMIGGGYRGQDEYNIYYQDSYAYVTFGLSAGLSFGTRR